MILVMALIYYITQCLIWAKDNLEVEYPFSKSCWYQQELWQLVWCKSLDYIVDRTHTDGVVETYSYLKREAERICLVINENKTKHMKTANTKVLNQHQSFVNIDGQDFETYDEFVYLETLT